MSAKRKAIVSQPSGVREELFNQAGIDKNELVRLLKLSLKAQEEALSATKVTRQYFHGVKIDENTDVDHAMRTKAASDIHDILNTKGSKSANTPQKVIQRVEIRIPLFAQIRPAQPAIEVKATEVPALPAPVIERDHRRSKKMAEHGLTSDDSE